MPFNDKEIELESGAGFLPVSGRGKRVLTAMLFLTLTISFMQPAGCLVGFDSSDAVCGNGVRESDEMCDGDDFGGQTCAGLTVYEHGELLCTDDCKLDFSLCHTCGNGRVEGPEKCDGIDLGGETCESLGFVGGTLGCLYDCSGFDTSECEEAEECGNDLAEDGEVCDGIDLRGETCESLEFEGGTLACLSDCSDYDTSGCFYTQAIGGEVIDYEENGTLYRIHIFREDGTLEVINGVDIEYLIVAGGGGGGIGNDNPSGGAGGGAGGVLLEGTFLSAGNYSVFVGRGGRGGTCDPSCSESGQGANGEDSSFAGFIAYGGGGGGGNEGAEQDGLDGGSGGGSTRGNDPGSGIDGQGHDGSQGDYGPENGARHGGGGGGAGSAGGLSEEGRSGGSGLTIFFTGTEITFATGGRGGDLSGSGPGANGTNGSGDGGSGGDGDTGIATNGGDGGDGIVIVRYKVSDLP